MLSFESAAKASNIIALVLLIISIIIIVLVNYGILPYNEALEEIAEEIVRKEIGIELKGLNNK